MGQEQQGKPCCMLPGSLARRRTEGWVQQGAAGLRAFQPGREGVSRKPVVLMPERVCSSGCRCSELA